jgi:NTE family protein
MFHNVALSGGGVHALAFLGCVKYLAEHDHLKEIHNVIGSSGGSIIALMIVLQCEYKDMIHITKRSYEKHKDKLKITFGSLINLYKKYGMTENKIVDLIVDDILDFKKIDYNVTFLELIKITGKNIIIPVTNLTQRKIEYLSVDTYPEMKIKTAIKMSTSVPIIFEPIKYYNDYYVDSMIYNNFPVDYFNQFSADVLGINLKNYFSNEEQNKMSLRKFIQLLIECIRTSLSDKPLEKYKHVCEVVIDNDIKNFDLYTMRFVVDNDIIDKLITIGYDSLNVFFQKIE